jgi:hypothetical protein
MTATIINFQVAKVLAETLEAYSRPAYGEFQWAKCAAVLLDMGHTVEIAATLLESRLMRWTREDAISYDAPTSDDLVRFLNTPAGVSAISYELAA